LSGAVDVRLLLEKLALELGMAEEFGDIPRLEPFVGPRELPRYLRDNLRPKTIIRSAPPAKGGVADLKQKVLQLIPYGPPGITPAQIAANPSIGHGYWLDVLWELKYLSDAGKVTVVYEHSRISRVWR
jgi:hypothetical protein